MKKIKKLKISKKGNVKFSKKTKKELT